MAAVESRPIEDILRALWDAGQRTLPGGGAEVLTERVRQKLAHKKGGPDKWLEVHRAAHKIGFRSTATMMYGHVETPEDIVEHWERIRALQDETGGFTAFIQRTVSDPAYRAAGRPVLRGLAPEVRERLLTVLLPLLRRLDYQSALHVLLSDLVGGVRVVDATGREVEIDLMSAHKSAVLEFKEEIVAIQLFVAVRRGIELLFGSDAVVRRDRC